MSRNAFSQATNMQQRRIVAKIMVLAAYINPVNKLSMHDLFLLFHSADMKLRRTQLRGSFWLHPSVTTSTVYESSDDNFKMLAQLAITPRDYLVKLAKEYLEQIDPDKVLRNQIAEANGENHLATWFSPSDGGEAVDVTPESPPKDDEVDIEASAKPCPMPVNVKALVSARARLYGKAAVRIVTYGLSPNQMQWLREETGANVNQGHEPDETCSPEMARLYRSCDILAVLGHDTPYQNTHVQGSKAEVISNSMSDIVIQTLQLMGQL